MKTKTSMNQGLSPLTAAIVATLLISITCAQGPALAEEKAWVLQERTLPVPAAASEAILVAHRAKIPVLSMDYRMPPEHPFPAAVEDVVAVWKSLLKERDANSTASCARQPSKQISTFMNHWRTASISQ